MVADVSKTELSFNTNGLNDTYVKVEMVAHNKYGNVTASKYFFIKSTPLNVGLPQMDFTLKNILFCGFLFMLAFAFGAKHAYKGAIIISLLAGLFYYAGLIDIPWTVISLAICYSVLAYLAKSAKEWEGYV